MKLADIVQRVRVDPRKLTDYALNTESPWGRHKARVFQQALGYTRQNYAALLAQVEQQALEGQATFHSQDEFGQRFTRWIWPCWALRVNKLWCVPAGSSRAGRTKPIW